MEGRAGVDCAKGVPNWLAEVPRAANFVAVASRKTIGWVASFRDTHISATVAIPEVVKCSALRR